MTKDSFTPGPWRLQPTSRPEQWLVVAGDDTMDRHNGDSFSLQFKEANARLIAAAPEMLAALQSVARDHLDVVLAKQVKDAVAKATGGA